MQGLHELSALIIEASVGMRGELRNMLSLGSISKVHHTASAKGAVRKLQEQAFDLILCEYHFGDGQDGQHFLEDARHNNLIPLATIFIMVTGESNYERVVSAAELAPNDYVLKPFAAEALLERIRRAMHKRDAFLPAYRFMEVGDVREAIAYCLESEERVAAYAVDFMRLRAELHVALGEAAEAETIYQRVLEMRAVPWARLGLAKTLLLQKRFDKAEAILEDLIGESKNYLDAYDWLAKTKEAAGKLAEAQQVLVGAVAVSPHGVRRLRRLGEVSIEVGDMDTAAEALGKVVDRSRYSQFRDPEDHVKLVKTLISKGDEEGAGKIVRDLEKNMRGLDKTEACSALSSAMVHAHAGEEESARQALAKAVAACKDVAGLSNDIRMELARSCLTHAMDDAASSVIADVMRNASDEAAIDKAKRVFEEAGKGHLANRLADQTRAEVIALIKAGVDKAKRQDFEGAVNLMLTAARKMPSNPQVAFNAALAVLQYLDNRGWDEQLAIQAQTLINCARRQDPPNARLGPLSDYFHTLLQKYGIAAVKA